MEIRTRFAPSPTGYLHIGGARTALFAWLFARKMQGKFILRIEDTDKERSTSEAIDAILEGMQWLGLDYDEGPFYQTKRFARYQEVIEQLIASGNAYYCHCSVDRLEVLRAAQMAQKLKPKYDGHCRHLHLERNQSGVVRFANPETGIISFHDLIRGEISVANTELDDLIIQRSDGTPTYNFSVVVDDWDMQISHVIRGDDHINNTPRQINLLTALGASIPHYAHVPMILGSDGKRLSKRHGATSVLAYRDEGFLPEALLNYLVRLGWSHGDQEIFSRQDMIDYFSLGQISRSPAVFNPDKLLWVNQHYIKNSSAPELVSELSYLLMRANINIGVGPALQDLIIALRDRAKTMIELAELCEHFYLEITHYDVEAVAKHVNADTTFVLKNFCLEVQDLSMWNEHALHDLIKNFCEKSTIKMPVLAQPLRIALTGQAISLGITTLIGLMGREKTLYRINKFIEFLEKHHNFSVP